MRNTEKSKCLRDLICSPKMEFLMEAHNGLSARIVEEAGFKGVWGSGFALSASLGLRDNNEASWTQQLDILDFMNDATSLPILMDGDSGYGNFNTFRRLVIKLEQRGIAGVCIEDKLFPKTNSFIKAENQRLEGISEFCGKIAAGKDSQVGSDFCVVARVEALIVGLGQEEALKRAYAYTEAGADAILIHSRRSDPGEILRFMEAWDRSNPIIIIPTMYYNTPVEVFEQAGISLVIWANHLLRASIAAMQDVAKTVFAEKSVKDVEAHIASVPEVFRLQNAEEYELAETKYMKRTVDASIQRNRLMRARETTAS